VSDGAFLIWTSGGRTDVGRVRQVNEDACLDDPELGLWAVADGMGGHDAGDLASGTVIDALAGIDPPADLDAFVAETVARLQDANRRLRAEAASRGQATIGTTAAVLCAFGGRCACVWVGDSRVYRMRGEIVERMTRDHSVVEEYVASGMSREEAESGPWRNYVTRAVGAHDELEVDTVVDDIQDGDVFLLCSDGLYKEVEEKELGELLARGDAPETANRLVDLTLTRGARDNVTVVVVRFHRPA
jgi:protein phosphatase